MQRQSTNLVATPLSPTTAFANAVLAAVRRSQGIALALLASACLFAPNSIWAQLIQTGSTWTAYGHSFYEHLGVGFGWNLAGGAGSGSRVVGLLPNGMLTPGGQLQFTQGGAGSAIPPFGGYDPNASARFGFGSQGPRGGFRLGLELGQGSTRSISSVAPSLTVQNGGSGAIMSGSWTPFVTGWIPIVGDAPGPAPLDNAVTRALQSGQLQLENLGSEGSSPAAGLADGAGSSAGLGGRSTAATASESVAAIRARKTAQQAALSAEIAQKLEEFEQHRATGRIDLARLALNRAVVLEPDPERKQRLRALLKSAR